MIQNQSMNQTQQRIMTKTPYHYQYQPQLVHFTTLKPNPQSQYHQTYTPTPHPHPYPQVKQLSTSQLNYSHLSTHNIYHPTDRLYDPLRDTLLDPQTIKQRSSQIPQITRHSYLSKNYKILSPEQVEYIKHNVYIPKDVQLSQTDHFYKVKNKQFVAVNTEQKIIGQPITPLELEKLKNQGVKRSMVVYDLKERIEQVDPVTNYTPRKIERKEKKIKQYKYNLYSIIDEPVNWIRQVGCKGANWWTENQIVASKNQPQSIKWMK